MMSESAEARYQSARQLYLKHTTAAELTEAAAQFAALGEYERAPWYLARCRTLLEFVPGHTVSYGNGTARPSAGGCWSSAASSVCCMRRRCSPRRPITISAS